MTYTERMTAIRAQAAYRRRVAWFGLPALLAPYTVSVPDVTVVPVQRRRMLSAEVRG